MLETAVWGTYYNVKTNLDDVKDEQFKTKVEFRLCVFVKQKELYL